MQNTVCRIRNSSFGTLDSVRPTHETVPIAKKWTQCIKSQFSRNLFLILGLAFSLVGLRSQVLRPAEPGTPNPPAPNPAPTAAANLTPQAGAPAPTSPDQPFEFLDGDRVLLLGDTLIEREQLYGYVESRIIRRFPNRNIIFRNLGWSADTVSGQSRVSFDWSKPEDEWFKQLMAEVASVKPTVAIIGYGMAHSFDGPSGIPKFKAGLAKLITAIQDLSQEKPVRFILLGPIRHENLGAPLPDPAKHNESLALYTEAIREIATEKNARFIPLFEVFPDGTKSDPPFPLTDNGIHLSAVGYWRLAEVIEQALGWNPVSWRLGILPDGTVRRGSQLIQPQNIQRRDDSIRFTALSDFLETHPAPGDETKIPRRTPANLLQFVRLKPGVYILKIDGQQVAGGSQEEWGAGLAINRGPAVDQAEKLRQAIIKKNELYFHRWRPQNETYLFGFRKYEQGQNAREIPMFDPLVSEQETKIAKLRKPAAHTYELAVYSPDSPQPLAPDSVKKSDPAQPAPKTAKTPVTPQPLPKFDVADGFEVQLFAEDPQLAKPIQMNFDTKGRLWVASSSVYPQIQPGQTADDKILILEDTNRDGKADKSTVFAEGLLIPTGIEPGDGGAYVGQSTELLHFKDTDGDGKADQRKIVLSSFGTEDTHHIIHTLRWGHDGQLYFNQSIYIHSHIETPHGVVRLNSGGIFHLRPPTLQLGIFCKGWINSWGHDFDAFGQSFVTDGAGGQGINYGVPGAMYVTYAGARRILGSVSPGSYPKFCGLETIASEHFPADWQGNFVTCDFRAHRVVRFAINDKDSAYVTKEMPDLLRTSDVTFRPIDVKLGPDGALYIADWSNPIIQHGEVDFRDPRRDHEHGRIWRVTAKSRSLVKHEDPTAASTPALLDQLLSANAFTRRQARRVLTERGTAIVPETLAWSQTQKTDQARLEALWTCQSVDVVQPQLLQTVLASSDARIRAAAVRVISFWHDRLPNPLETLAPFAADAHPRVRLEAVRALSKIPSAKSAELVLSVLDKPLDSFLEYAVWLSINDLAQPWIEAVQSGAWKIDGREKQLEYALQAIEPKLAGPVLAQLLKDKLLPRDGSGPWIDLIGKAGAPAELNRLLEPVVNESFEPPAAVRALASLRHAARVRKLKPTGDLAAIAKTANHSNPALQSDALRLIGLWQLKDQAPLLLSKAGTAQNPQVREAAFEGLRELAGSEVLAGLQTLAAKERPLPTRRLAAQSLAALDLKAGLPSVIQVVLDTTSEDEALELWRSILSNKGAARLMADALGKISISPAAAKAGMRAAREGGRNEPELVFALALSGNLEAEARQLTAAEIQQLAQTITKTGNPTRGENVYRRTELGCVNCHAIGGVGGKVGPDMTSIGASAPLDYLIESLLYPNRKVKEGYHSLLVETKDGQELSGILVRESNEQLILRDATNREVSIPKNDIEKRTTGGSIMPSGLIDALSAADQIDLFRFLAELGKPGPFDAAKGNVARNWKLLTATIDLAQFGDDKILNTSLGDRQWTDAASLVDGRLLKESLEQRIKASGDRRSASLYGAAQFQTAAASRVNLQLSSTPVAGIWVNGKAVQPHGPIAVDLPPGLHTVIVKMDVRQLPDFLRLEVSDGTFVSN